MEYYMTDERITEYLKALESEERAAATIEKYRRALLSFAAFLSGAAVTPEMIRLWKDDLRASNYAPSTINACLAALNGFFRFCGWTDCRARFLKIQRRLFRDSRQELTRGEYERLVTAAEAARDRALALLMETICSTGIRVSEVQYITVEAAKNGKNEIALKGKIRTILLPVKLCRKLLKFAARQKTASGAIFRAKSGKAMSRYQIWSKMKKLCVRAGRSERGPIAHAVEQLGYAQAKILGFVLDDVTASSGSYGYGKYKRYGYGRSYGYGYGYGYSSRQKAPDGAPMGDGPP